MRAPTAIALLLLFLAALTAGCGGGSRPYQKPDAVSGATDLTLQRAPLGAVSPLGAAVK
jgi:hypothetical protein